MNIRGTGYTLVEVLIFLALTSFLLFIAVANIGGSQADVRFSQGVRDYESRLSDIINDVPTGFFPTNSVLTCDASSSPGRPVIGDSGGDGLGADEDCVYVGKAVQFVPDDLSNRDELRIYSLAGRRYVSPGSASLANTLDEVQPVAIASTLFDDSVQNVTFETGVQVDKVFNGALPARQYGIMTVLTSFQGGSPGADASSNAQEVQIGGLLGSSLGDDKSAAIGAIGTTDSTTFETAREGIVVCLIDDRGKRASLTIGQFGSPAVFLQIDDYDTRCT